MMATREERRQDIRDKISEWTHGPDWKTWVAHTVFGLIIAIVVGGIAASIWAFCRILRCNRSNLLLSDP